MSRDWPGFAQPAERHVIAARSGGMTVDGFVRDVQAPTRRKSIQQAAESFQENERADSA